MELSASVVLFREEETKREGEGEGEAGGRHYLRCSAEAPRRGWQYFAVARERPSMRRMRGENCMVETGKG